MKKLWLLLALIPAWAYCQWQSGGTVSPHAHTGPNDGGANIQPTGTTTIPVGSTLNIRGTLGTTAGATINLNGTTNLAGTANFTGTVTGVPTTAANNAWTGNETYAGTETFNNTVTLSTGASLGLMGDPASPSEGQIWYNSTAHAIRYQNNSRSVELDPYYLVLSNVAEWTTGASYSSAFCAATSLYDVGSTTIGTAGCSTTESNEQSIVPTAGTIVRMSIFNSGNCSSSTVTLRKNATNTSLNCSLAGNPSSCTSNTNVTVAAGDLLDFSWNASACTPANGGVVIQSIAIQPSATP